jgi:hypothetical protein
MSELMLTSDARYSKKYSCCAFYSFQIVEFVATLALDADGETEGLPVAFENIGESGTSLQPYGKEGVDWFPVDGDPTQVLVYMKRLDARRGVAKLRALVVGTISTKNDVKRGETRALIGSTYQSNPLEYCIFGVYAQAPSYPGILNVSPVDQTPSSSHGNYLHYQLQVTTDGTDGEISAYTGLPNMCISLTAAGSDVDSTFLTNVLLYTNPAEPARIVDTSSGTPTLDLITDAEGTADLYVCAKANRTACASISCQAGVAVPAIGPILVTNIAALDSSLTAPDCDNPLTLDAGVSTAQAKMPKYKDAQAGDQIFLFCNGRYQSSGVLPESLYLTLPFQTGCVRSEDATYGDQEQNKVWYVTASNQVTRVSPIKPFRATGEPPVAKWETVSPEFPEPLAAPVILEAADGWPVNCNTIASGLTVRVPIDANTMQLGDVIVIQMMLNGYRVASNEPLGMRLPTPGNGGDWPESLVVTTHAMSQGYITWRFLQYHFQGFGQLHSAKQDSGAVGTLNCRYTVQRVDGNTFVAYCSSILSIGLDTIPPDGQTGLSEGVPPELAERFRV